MNQFCEYDIQRIIAYNWYSSNNLIVPNINGGLGEIDVLRLTKAGYAYEYEVKISRNDFNADKKKRYKHQEYLDIYGGKPRTWWDDKPRSKKGIPNYFIYVCPKEIIPIKSVPVYAGLYEIENNHLSCVKSPPKIHSEKYRDYWVGKIASALNAKYFYHYWFRKNDLAD